jgi:hypothetical protein
MEHRGTLVQHLLSELGPEIHACRVDKNVVLNAEAWSTLMRGWIEDHRHAEDKAFADLKSEKDLLMSPEVLSFVETHNTRRANRNEAGGTFFPLAAASFPGDLDLAGMSPAEMLAAKCLKQMPTTHIKSEAAKFNLANRIAGFVKQHTFFVPALLILHQWLSNPLVWELLQKTNTALKPLKHWRTWHELTVAPTPTRKWKSKANSILEYALDADLRQQRTLQQQRVANWIRLTFELISVSKIEVQVAEEAADTGKGKQKEKEKEPSLQRRAAARPESLAKAMGLLRVRDSLLQFVPSFH